MQINREKVLKALQLIKPGISTKERVDQSASVAFVDGHMTSYNDQVMVMLPTELDIEGAVRAEELISVLNKLSAEQVDISVDIGQVIVKAGRSKAGIRFEYSIRLPFKDVLETYSKVEMQAFPDSLLDAFKRAKFCASSNANNPLLMGIHYADGKVMATDNYRAIQITLPKKDIKGLPEFLLPAGCVDALLQYKLEKIGISESWAFFSGAEGLLFCVRLISTASETYPDISRVLDVQGPEVFLPARLVEAIDKTSIFTKTVPHETDRRVTVTMKPGRVVLKGEGAFGWYEESIPAKEYDGEEIQFAANPDFLASILPHVQRAIYGEDRLLLFTGADFSYVFALCCME